MPRRKGPIVDLRDELVLDRVAVNVGDVRRKIVQIGDHVFPEPTLPHPTLAPSAASGKVGRARKATGETGLDPPPPPGKVRVAFGQRPDAMQVVGQDADRNGPKRLAPRGVAIGGAQRGDVLDQQPAVAAQQVGGKEVGSPRNEPAAVVRHRHGVTRPAPRR